MISRKEGAGSSNRGPAPNRRRTLAARIRLMKTLAQNATAKKMLRHPSFRFADMTGQTGGDQSLAQAGKQGEWSSEVTEQPQRLPPYYSITPSLHHSNFPIWARWLGSCFFHHHEQRRSS